ncbi:hypothetical protein DL239_14710 [Sedimentitalea sp. CY04]|uniref:Uncharacterized protein n=1 Tax=Parasedimentitalea denitrificans TaxID=2211118 RepID=A0ABX0W9E5_9RHOB|nr:hypothetical protein [Sedimentitalea sp. CY04]
MKEWTSGHMADITCTHEHIREANAGRIKASLVEAERQRAERTYLVQSSAERRKASFVESERRRAKRLEAELMEAVQLKEVWLRQEWPKAESVKIKGPTGALRASIALFVQSVLPTPSL